MKELNAARIARQQQQQTNTTTTTTKQTGNDKELTHPNFIAACCSTIALRAKQTSGNIWSFLRNHYNSRIGYFAFGMAVFFSAVYLLSSFRRRRQLINNNNNNDDDNTENNVHNRTKSKNTPPATNTNTKLTKRLITQPQQYGMNHVQSGFWSNVSDLLSGALSLK